MSILPIKELYWLIDERRFTEAENILSSYPESLSPADARTREFFRAQLLIRQEKYAECIALTERTIATHGAHLTLLIVLAWAHHHRQDYNSWRKVMHELEQSFLQVRDRLGPDTMARTQVALGIFREELAEVSAARDLYLNVIENARVDVDSPQLVIRAKANLLRLLCYHQDQSELKKSLYQELFLLPDNYPTKYIFEDVQHALLYAELDRKNSTLSNWALDDILQKCARRNYDSSLFLMDYLEEILSFHPEKLQEIPKILQRTKNLELGRFDECLVALAQNFHAGKTLGSEAFQIIHQVRSQVPAPRFLALLHIFLQAKIADPQIFKEAKVIMQAMLDGMKQSDKSMWLRRLQSQQAPATQSPSFPRVSIQIDDRGSLQWRNHYFSLTQQAQARRLLEILSEEDDNHSLEDVSRQLWQDEAYTELHWGRLRNLAHRTNKILLNLCGISNAVKVTKAGILLAPTMKIMRVSH